MSPVQAEAGDRRQKKARWRERQRAIRCSGADQAMLKLCYGLSVSRRHKPVTVLISNLEQSSRLVDKMTICCVFGRSKKPRIRVPRFQVLSTKGKPKPQHGSGRRNEAIAAPVRVALQHAAQHSVCAAVLPVQPRQSEGGRHSQAKKERRSKAWQCVVAVVSNANGIPLLYSIILQSVASSPKGANGSTDHYPR